MIGVTCPRCQQQWFCNAMDAFRAGVCPVGTEGPSRDTRPVPPDPVSAALRDLVGWALVIFTTMLGGLWLGMSLGVGRLAPLQGAFALLLFLPLSWLLFPRVLL